MEYGWKCVLGHGVRNLKTIGMSYKMRIFGIYFILFLWLSLSAAFYSHAAEQLTLERAIAIALVNNPGLKAATWGIIF